MNELKPCHIRSSSLPSVGSQASPKTPQSISYPKGLDELNPKLWLNIWMERAPFGELHPLIYLLARYDSHVGEIGYN